MPKHARTSSLEDVLRHPSPKRAKEIDDNSPYDKLLAYNEEAKNVSNTRNVLHWFRSKDIRVEDNRALDAASKKAKQGNGILLTCFLHSPKDIEWHGTSPAREDFVLESLRLVQNQLHGMYIPLTVITAEERKQKVDKILSFIKEHDISHIYANIEYEIDEIRRDIALFKRLEKEKGVEFKLFHDQTVVEPGILVSGNGKPRKVFTPYHKAWLDKVAKNPELLDLYDVPSPNDKSVHSKYSDLFDVPIPSLPESKQFASKDEEERIRKLWPAGHEAACQRLNNFLKKKVQNYATYRSDPSKDVSSRLSPYFAAGVLSVREAVTAAKKANKGAQFDHSGDPGIASWVREIVFREFYRQMTVITPHTAMNLPHNLKFSFIKWEEDEEGWKMWCEGRTGVPFVDAGMRQLNSEAFMHNRLRMNVASYLRANLLIDYRRGERYFVEHLIDWDLSNNTQGWEPNYTVFNPVAQAEKNDPNGDYIRKWVPELRGVKGKAIFDPYNRLSEKEFAKLGYPKPHVDFMESKQRCLTRYKESTSGAKI